MQQAICVDNLFVTYRGKSGRHINAVNGLSFQVSAGEVVGFLGPNGAGKSSTLKALMGFVEPVSGSGTIFGEPAGSMSARARTGYLPEVALYYPFLTPIETLKLYGELQGLGGKSLHSEAMELLDLVGIAASAKKLNRTLSKGMLQRVGIAQALLGSPELLVLDEVTSGLDPIGRRELRSLLKERQKQGCTLFFSSHELSEVEMLCDRVLVIDQGKLIEERDLEGLKDELRQYVLTYAGEVSLLGLTQDWSEIEPGIYRAQFATKAALIHAMERVHQEGRTIVDVIAQEGSLEDYFVETLARAA
jgi:ABC-2 type transport system ATP-binding protein